MRGTVDAEWKQKRGGDGGRTNILESAGDAEDVLGVALCMKTETERRNKNTGNMPTVNGET